MVPSALGVFIARMVVTSSLFLDCSLRAHSCVGSGWRQHLRHQVARQLKASLLDEVAVEYVRYAFPVPHGVFQQLNCV